jgi:peroxiredoxin
VDQDESRRGEWGYVEVLTEAGQPAPYVWRGGTPNLWKVEPRRRYKVNSFLNGMPLRKSGPGTYRVRLTLRIRNVRTNESTFVSSDWHTFRVTPAGRLPGQARGPYEEFQEAEAYAGTCDFGHGTRQDAIRQLLALAQKYPGTKYALAAYFSAANQADALANETGDAAHAAQRREYFREIMARWPDVVHYHTIYARLHVQWGDSTSEFLQSRRNTYQWLLSLTEEQKIASVKEYASLLPGTLTDEDVPRFLPGLNKYIAQTQKMLEESIPGLGADVSKSQAGPGKVEPVPAEISGRLLDPAGRPAAGAQVALCTKDKGVIIQEGQLVPTTWGGRTSAIASTDAEGRFTFSSRPEEFHLVAAHEQGFAWVIDRELTDSADLRLVPWARIEGTLRIGREVGTDKRVSLLNFINKNAIDQGVHFEYRVETDGAGRFAFARVPPTWMEVGYMVRVGDSMWTDTSRTPIHLQPGQSLTMTLGGEGRPVVGRFVPPADYRGPVYFGAGLRAFATQRPDLPRPADYDRMTQREQQEWLKQWSKTPAAEAFYNVRWHDLNRRHYSFRIENDGLFRIEDVIPGEYQFTVWLEERFSGSGHPQEIGGYYGPVDVPPQTEAYTDEPLDLGDLTLKMRSPPLHVGDPAPLFETQTLDGNDIRLLDYRGKFVLLSFWQPTFHPELDRLKELQQTYGVDRLAILDFAVSDTLAEVESYIREHQIEWPEIYLGETKDNDIAKRYGDPVASYILLVDPEGKIVATWLREEKLTEAVQGALGKAD